MVVIPVVPKLNSLLTGRPVRFAPSPTKLDAVTIPLNLAPPSSYIVAPFFVNQPLLHYVIFFRLEIM